jgi:hypothetical protein
MQPSDSFNYLLRTPELVEKIALNTISVVDEFLILFYLVPIIPLRKKNFESEYKSLAGQT